MYKIGLFSKMNKITIKTLRHYDEIGLFKPCYVDKLTGYRYYSSIQLPRLHRILNFKRIGFSLNEIMILLEEETTTDDMIDYLANKELEIIRTIEKEQIKLTQIKSHLKSLKKESIYMKYNVILKELPEVIVASMRTVISNYDMYYKIYPEMGQYMEKQQVKCAVPEYCFTIYHDGEYKEEDIDVEICEAVTDYGKDSEKIKFKKIEHIQSAACVLHKGSYENISMAYGAVIKWIEQNDYKIIGPPRESYIDGVWNKENPEEWLTEIQIPVITNN